MAKFVKCSESIGLQFQLFETVVQFFEAQSVPPLRIDMRSDPKNSSPVAAASLSCQVNHLRYMGVSIVMGVLLYRWKVYFREDPNLKWVITGVITPMT